METGSVLAILVVITCGWCAPPVDGFSRGPPVTYCREMQPNHGDTVNSLTDAPFNFSADSSCYTPGQSMTVILRGLARQTFRGFFVQARRPNSDSLSYGTFDFDSSKDDFRTIDCFGNDDSAISHADSAEKTHAVFTWTPPSDLKEDIQLVATVVENFRAFWAGRLRVLLAQCVQTTTSSDPWTSDSRASSPTTLDKSMDTDKTPEKEERNVTSTASRFGSILPSSVETWRDFRTVLQLSVVIVAGVLVRWQQG